MRPLIQQTFSLMLEGGGAGIDTRYSSCTGYPGMNTVLLLREQMNQRITDSDRRRAAGTDWEGAGSQEPLQGAHQKRLFQEGSWADS